MKDSDYWVYSFTIRSLRRHTKHGTRLLFHTALSGRVEMEFSEDEFARFREDLLADNLELREISRVPYHDAEAVL